SFSVSAVNNDFTAFRKVFLRWLKAVFTSKKNIFSVVTGRDSFFGVSRITALFTFGGGLKACASTSNKYSTSKKAWRSTLVTPYILFPSGAAIRWATSF